MYKAMMTKTLLCIRTIMCPLCVDLVLLLLSLCAYVFIHIHRLCPFHQPSGPASPLAYLGRLLHPISPPQQSHIVHQPKSCPFYTPPSGPSAFSPSPTLPFPSVASSFRTLRMLVASQLARWICRILHRNLGGARRSVPVHRLLSSSFTTSLPLPHLLFCPPPSSPQILPVPELVKVVSSILYRSLSGAIQRICRSRGMHKLADRLPEVQMYQPDFKRAGKSQRGYVYV